MGDFPPVYDESELPPLPEGKCGRRNKRCRDCGYRFEAGDKTWTCPMCGGDRRCRSPKYKKFDTCRMHGGGGGRPPSQKYTIGRNIQAAYNRILASPELLNVSQEIASVDARIDQLHRMLADANGAAFDMIEQGLKEARNGLMFGNQGKLSRGISMALDGVTQFQTEKEIWRLIRENTLLSLKLKDSQRKWNLEAHQMLSVQQIIEVIALFQQLVFRYLTNPIDRKNFILDIEKYLPRKDDVIDIE